VSYALTVAFSAVTFVIWYKFIGFSDNENNLLYWLISNAVGMIAIQPYLMRVSRTGWLAFFVN
jgi:integral membrane sensor domain MASE1